MGALLLSLFVAGALAVATLPTMVAARSDLLRGRGLAERGTAALREGDVATAARRFAEARAAFADADSSLSGLAPRLAGVIPLFGGNVEAVASYARSAELAARGAGVVAAALAEPSGGLGTFLPHRGRVPLEPIVALREPMQRAHALFVRAAAESRGAPASWLLPQIGDAGVRLRDEVGRGVQALAAAEALTAALPEFLGAGGSRRYFVGAQNPAELRGTGGFLGVYAILEVRNGELILEDFEPIQELRSLPASRVRAPNRDFARRYNDFGGAGFWHNINMTPDFPSTARAIEALYVRTTGVTLDGTIFVDPFMLQRLIEATGPVAVPNVGVELNASNAIDYVTNGVYRDFRDAETRKRALGDFAGVVFDRFLSGEIGKRPSEALRGLAHAISGGHLLLHARDPDVQEAFDRAGVSGRLRNPHGDFLAVVANNAAANKIDFYAERLVTYRATLHPDGSVRSRLGVRLRNEAPSTGEPAYVIGPATEVAEAGDNITYLSVYAARRAALEGFFVDGERQGVGAESELGHPVFVRTVRIPAKRTKHFAYELEIPAGWDAGESEGVYRLTFQDQPTLRPTSLRVEVRAPEGMSIADASPGMTIHDDRAVWSGEPDGTLTLEVTLERPLPQRLWRDVLDLLHRPVVRLGAKSG